MARLCERADKASRRAQPRPRPDPSLDLRVAQDRWTYKHKHHLCDPTHASNNMKPNGITNDTRSLAHRLGSAQALLSGNRPHQVCGVRSPHQVRRCTSHFSVGDGQPARIAHLQASCVLSTVGLLLGPSVALLEFAVQEVASSLSEVAEDELTLTAKGA